MLQSSSWPWPWALSCTLPRPSPPPPSGRRSRGASEAVVWEGTATLWGDRWRPYFRTYYTLDFSQFRTPGRYRLRCQGVDSYPFAIAETFEPEPWHLAADIYFPVAMCGIKVPAWHDACHTGDARQPEEGETVWHGGGPGYGVEYPILQQSPVFTPGLVIDTVGGWHDAGDYNKYMGSTPWVLVTLGLTVEEFDPQRDVYGFDTLAALSAPRQHSYLPLVLRDYASSPCNTSPSGSRPAAWQALRYSLTKAPMSPAKAWGRWRKKGVKARTPSPKASAASAWRSNPRSTLP